MTSFAAAVERIKGDVAHAVPTALVDRVTAVLASPAATGSSPRR